ncbi:hypothetical protein ACFL0S_07005 [Thermodesulfobacteriota bacterium]
MRVSPKKRAANRRNALKSTGPKTVSGRRASSQNAIRHGLSVPLPTHLAEAVQQELVQLIMSDGFDHDVAHDLAEKIIDYERNISYLNDIIKLKPISTSDPSPTKRATIHKLKQRQERFATTLEYLIQQEPQVDNKEALDEEDLDLRKTLSQVKQLGNGLIQAERMIDIKRVAHSQRYFKRASNQLIKALRRL